MRFHDIEIKSEYSSLINDIYGEFFNKILPLSRQYVRIGGQFTSKNFAACAEGLQEFIQKEGFMKLVLIPEFNEEDAVSINKGIKNVCDIISECWIRDFSEIHEKFVQDHTKALAWMIANGNLEIKLVIPIRSDGTIITAMDLKESEIFQRKTGIFWDEDNDAVSFSGNMSYTDKILGEYYNFRTYRSWNESESKYVENDLEEFHRYWDGEEFQAGIKFKAIPLPEAIKNNLLKIAPKSKSEIQLHNIPRLRTYQKEAIDNWIENDHRGIFEMATGTGKTFTAIGCIDRVRKLKDKLLVVIACPFDNLERQWKTELEKWNLESVITSDSSKWQQMMKDKIASMHEYDQKKPLIIITTYQTFCNNNFVKIIEKSNVTNMLIADEVHNAGSSAHIYGLSTDYHYRLGLSATLARHYDEDGTLVINNFFGGTVYDLNLKDAIKKGFLINYYYYPIYADLNDEEYEQYRILTRTIARLLNSKIPEKKMLEMTLLKRARIIRDAESKFEKFIDWIKIQKDDMKYTLIYCSEKQIVKVKKKLNQEGITNREITAKNPSKPSERIDIIKYFSSGNYDCIVANRVLDEGVDIPAAKNCIMLASTGNPKQFIQRRGRVLRKFDGTYKDHSKKEYAKIYDILIIPDISSNYTEEEIKIEQGIAASQIKRQKEMASAALNHDECMKEISKLNDKFGINDT